MPDVRFDALHNKPIRPQLRRIPGGRWEGEAAGDRYVVRALPTDDQPDAVGGFTAEVPGLRETRFWARSLEGIKDRLEDLERQYRASRPTPPPFTGDPFEGVTPHEGFRP